MLAGAPFAHEIDFSTGLPTGAVVYSVLGNSGTAIVGLNNVSVTPAAGAMSLVLLVPGTANTCANPLFETRTLIWSYTTAAGLVTGRTRYRVEKEVPFPVSADGVRAKLGVEAHEVEDKDIDLLMAYARVAGNYSSGGIDAYANAGDMNTLVVLNAIEAQAALDVLPSLQLAIAKAEDSGTNKYQRFSTIDWDALAASLGQAMTRLDDLMGVDNLVNVNFSILIAAGPTNDRVTGAEYV